MTDTEATIIDFDAYRSRRQVRRSNASSRDGAPYEFIATTAAVPVPWFWPVFVWMPVFVPVDTAAERGS